MFDQIPAELRNAGPGVSGSLLALLFMRRPPLQMVGIFIGGALLAFFAADWLADLLEMEKFDGLIGFLVGLMGMRLVEKAYEFIEAISASDLWTALKDFVRKRLGV